MDSQIMLNERLMDGQIMLNEKLEFLDILKQSLSIPFKNIKFIILTLFASIPYFFFSVFFEIFLQKTLLDTFNFIPPSSNYSYISLDEDGDSLIPFRVDEHISRGNLSAEWIKLCLLYLAPCHLLGFLNIIIVVNAVSMIYAAAEKPIGFGDLTRQKTRLKGPLITSIYVFLLSTCILLGLVGVISNWYTLSRGFLSHFYYYDELSYYYSYYDQPEYVVGSLITIFHVALFIALLVKYSEWSAGWNMALVISILEEETYGIEAFQMSAYFGRGGNTRRGLCLMIVFTVWEMVFRLPCLFGKCSGSVGGIPFIYVSTSLICIGNLLKWVVCVVYFFDCKKRILEKKVDEEVGRGDVGVVDV